MSKVPLEISGCSHLQTWEEGFFFFFLLLYFSVTIKITSDIFTRKRGFSKKQWYLWLSSLKSFVYRWVISKLQWACFVFWGDGSREQIVRPMIYTCVAMNIAVMNFMLCHNECYKEIFFSLFFIENVQFGCTSGKIPRFLWCLTFNLFFHHFFFMIKLAYSRQWNSSELLYLRVPWIQSPFSYLTTFRGS